LRPSDQREELHTSKDSIALQVIQTSSPQAVREDLALSGKRQERVDTPNQQWIISTTATFLDSISKTYDNSSSIISFLFPCCIHYNPVEEMIKYLQDNFGYPKDFVFDNSNINMMMMMDYTSINNVDNQFRRQGYWEIMYWSNFGGCECLHSDGYYIDDVKTGVWNYYNSRVLICKTLYIS
jgi:hypothetical protein